jgi:drug/metabolite transporter (DMT)-like permease
MTSAASARLRLLGAAALFSTGGAAIKACAFSGFEVAALRSGIAALALLIMIPAARAWPSRREWLVGVSYAATLVLFVVANKLTSAAHTIFLQSTAPLYILLFGPWLLRERITKRDLVFLVVMACGLVLVLVDERHESATSTNPALGNALALASGVCWACTVVGLRWLSTRAAQKRSSALGAVVAGNSMAFLACAPLAFPIAVGDARDWTIIVYLGVFQIGLAYVLLTSAMSLVTAFEAAVLLLVEPVLSPLWAFLVHGETPGPWTFAGGAILLGATLARTWSESRAETRPA